MKDKKTLYLLIPLVLIIWGYVGYKFFTFGNEDEVIEPIRVGDIIAKEEALKRKPELSLSYKDPFLKNVRNKSYIPKTTKISKPKKNEPKVNWGEINYNGYMNNSQKRKKIALLRINEKSVLGEIGNQYNGIGILKIEEDSILLKKEQASKWFLKSKN